jgi:sulfonate transport system substrate-binding protein
MTLISRRSFGIAVGVSGASLAFPYVARSQTLDTIRFCWNPVVSVSAQLQHALQRTDIAERNGIKLDMRTMSSGPSMTEALVSNAADMASFSDFSAVIAMAANAPLKTVAHQSRFRSAVLTTTKAGINSMADLRGRQIFGLFGITAYQNAQEAVRAAGLKVGSDVTFVNIGTAELSDAIRAQRIDAFFMWDPWVTLFESAGLAKVISQNDSPAMVIEARTDFVSKRPEVVKRFLKAHSEALYFATQNREVTNRWFRSVEATKSIPEDVIERASSFDPQWAAKAPSDIKTALTEQGVKNIQHQANWAFEEKLIPRVPKVDEFINTDIAKSVDAEMMTSTFDPAAVKVLRA